MSHERRIVLTDNGLNAALCYCTTCGWSVVKGLPHLDAEWNRHLKATAPTLVGRYDRRVK